MRHRLDNLPFISNTGMMGLGPYDTVPGDYIFIIVGAPVPLILRHAGQGLYRIVGEAYVYGIMDGEFVEGGPEIEELVII